MTTLLAALALTAASSLPAVALAQAGGLLVTPAELAASLKDPSVVVIAVGQGDFVAGHIPGARLIAYDDIAIDGPERLGSELPPVEQLRTVFAAAGVSDKSRVVLYGSPIAATRAFFTLDYLGKDNVQILNGGIAAWKLAGQPVETGESRRSSTQDSRAKADGSFNPKAHPEKVALATWIVERLNGGAITLIDARPDPEFTGSDGGMGGQHAPGHLPGANQLVWDQLVDRSGKFIPDADLRAKMTAAGAKPGAPVVSYCMVGMRASVTYFVARHLGFDAKLYDGSIIDWTRRKLPVKAGR